MTPAETKAAAELMLKHAASMEAGSPIAIQWCFQKSDADGDWTTGAKPLWNWAAFAYRERPEPKYIPFNRETAPVGKVVRRRSDGLRSLVAYALDGEVYVAQAGHVTLARLLADWTMDDGSPCGVLEGEG